MDAADDEVIVDSPPENEGTSHPLIHPDLWEKMLHKPPVTPEGKTHIEGVYKGFPV